MGLIVLVSRKHKDSEIAVDEYIIDFIKFIRSDTVGDPEKFLLSMRRYMFRFMFIVGLRVAFGIDWRDFVSEILELKKKPQINTYHYLFVNVYIRNLLQAYSVWKYYKAPGDEGYVLGVNDLATLAQAQANLKTSLGLEKLTALIEALQQTLPSWNHNIRKQAAWHIDTCHQGIYLRERQYSEKQQRNT